MILQSKWKVWIYIQLAFNYFLEISIGCFKWFIANKKYKWICKRKPFDDGFHIYFIEFSLNVYKMDWIKRYWVCGLWCFDESTKMKFDTHKNVEKGFIFSLYPHCNLWECWSGTITEPHWKNLLIFFAAIFSSPFFPFCSQFL